MTDKLDSLPQLDKAGGNHAVYGFFANAIVAAIAHWFGILDIRECWGIGFYVVLFAAAAKKIYDYHYEHESWRICAVKIIETMGIPATIGVLQYAHLV